MSDTNLNYLRTNLNRVGFPEEVMQKMQDQMKAGGDKFSVGHEATKNGELVQYELKFKQSAETGNYFFNSYSATLKTGVDDRDKTQNFTIRNGNNVTMDEAFNLAAGRAVQKAMVNSDGDTYQAWLKVDFSQKDKYDNYKIDQFHERYGYSVEKALDKFPIAELAKPDEREKLVESLKAGNSTAVMIAKGGKEEMVFVEANPRLRTINIKDEKGVSMKRDELQIKDTSKSKEIAEKHAHDQEQNKSKGKRTSLSV